MEKVEQEAGFLDYLVIGLLEFTRGLKFGYWNLMHFSHLFRSRPKIQERGRRRLPVSAIPGRESRHENAQSWHFVGEPSETQHSSVPYRDSTNSPRKDKEQGSGCFWPDP